MTDVLLSSGFWAFVALAYVLLYVELPIPATLRFAVLNVFAVALFFGAGSAAALAALAVILWGALRLALVLRDRHPTTAKVCALTIVVGIVGLFVLYKLYFDAMLTGGDAADRPSALAPLYSVLRAISFSYVFLRCIDLTRCVLTAGTRLTDPVSLCGYLGPFHMLISGPIASYASHVRMDDAERPRPTFGHLLGATNTIVTGLFFKIVIAQAMKLFLFGVNGAIVSTSWFDTAYLLVYLYFDFAGYSLIALGIGSLLHVPTPVNFDRPYLATSVTAFWQRWHVSLGTFIRDNLYLPMQFALVRRVRRRAAPTVLGLLPLAIAFVFVGMWHRFTLIFLAWGVGMAIVLVAEKLVRDRLLGTRLATNRITIIATRVLGPIYAWSIVVTSIHFAASEIFLA